jgi:hypothetical protein
VDAETRNRRLSSKQKELISRDFVKPSDGLEPSTPSLPSRFRGVMRVHARSLATPFLLQIGSSKASGMRRQASRLSLLMAVLCPRSVDAADNAFSEPWRDAS